MYVVATAGHVDHGKSALVRALTGNDPDRLAEEQRRGLTIDLGFAFTQLPSGEEVGIVDVPGHLRFIRNMLAGVGSVDAVLFVVAATEGSMPQSEEHLRILDLLGASRGLLVLSKADLVDEVSLEVVALEVAEHVAGTFLEAAPRIVIDAISGRGVPELLIALDSIFVDVPPSEDCGRPRLWVDRSFVVSGAGTIVTGTLRGGGLRTGERLEIAPGRGGGPSISVRLRTLHAGGRAFDSVRPGWRVACNLVGVTHDEVGRGQALLRPNQWELTTTVDASLSVLPALGRTIGRRGAYHAFVGSGRFPVRVRLLGETSLEPGTEGCVRFHLPVPIPVVPGDRYVLREAGRSETVGGGEILDIAPRLPASKARPSRSVARVVSERGFVEADLLERLTGVRIAPDLAGRWVADPVALASARERLLAAIKEAETFGLDVAVLSALDRAVLETLPKVVVITGRAKLDGNETDSLVGHWLLAHLEADLFAPPAPAELGVDPVELRELVRRGFVLSSGGIYFSKIAVSHAAALLRPAFAANPQGLTTSAIRDVLGTSRKFVLALLGHLDAVGGTRRRGDVRVAGPRLGALAVESANGAVEFEAEQRADSVRPQSHSHIGEVSGG